MNKVMEPHGHPIIQYVLSTFLSVKRCDFKIWPWQNRRVNLFLSPTFLLSGWSISSKLPCIIYLTPAYFMHFIQSTSTALNTSALEDDKELAGIETHTNLSSSFSTLRKEQMLAPCVSDGDAVTLTLQQGIEERKHPGQWLHSDLLL